MPIMISEELFGKMVQDCTDRTNQLAEANATIKEQSAEKNRLAREIDVALCGEEGAAEQASLCDLIGPARDLREMLAWCAEQLADVGDTIDRQDFLDEMKRRGLMPEADAED